MEKHTDLVANADDDKLAQESKTGAAPSTSPLRNPQGRDKHGDRHSESKGGQR